RLGQSYATVSEWSSRPEGRRMSASRVTRPTVAPPRLKIPPLEPGDHLTRAEFERRWDAMPHLKRAELIDGVVHMPPAAIRFEYHSSQHGDLLGWLVFYKANTPGVRTGGNASVRLSEDTEPQPDGLLLIDPACGGRARISKDGYVEGIPELAAEVSA